MVKTVLILSMLGALNGTPQTAPEQLTPATGTQVVSATEVVQWKVEIFNSLSTMNQLPYDVMANLFLTNAIGMPVIPEGTGTVTIPMSSYQRFTNIHRYIKSAAGIIVLNKMSDLGIKDKASLKTTINSAAGTIPDKKQREEFLKKTRALTE